MKRCLSIMLALCLTLSLAACGAQDGGASTSSAPNPAQSTAPENLVEEFPRLSRGDLIAANEAVYAHYDETGLEVLTLTEITPEEGELAFHVEFPDGEADRIISLERRDGQWVVLSEGH